MKLVFAGLLFAANTVLADDSGYYQFKAPVIKEIASSSFDNHLMIGNFSECGDTANMLSEVAEMNPIEAVDFVDVMVDKVVNIGKKVWAVVELGRPVANFKTDTANALPKGIACWSDLAGWAPTQSRTYSVAYENLFGATVVEFHFRVLYTAGGNFKGKGRYITNATILPALVNVSWGYTFNANGEVPTVMNAGTKEQPLAAMQLNMKWKVETVLRTEETTESFYIDGNGTLKRLE